LQVNIFLKNWGLNKFLKQPTEPTCRWPSFRFDSRGLVISNDQRRGGGHKS
jgi:hypothetical protein